MQVVDTIEGYVDAAADDAREPLLRVLAAIRDAAPGAPEKLRYGMPAVELAPGRWMHVAAWKRHLGVYPVPPLPAALEQRILPYRTTTSTVKLPLDGVPTDLIADIARHLAALDAGTAGGPGDARPRSAP